MKRIAALTITLLACCTFSQCGALAQQRAQMPEARRAEHVASFVQVWNTVRDQHWDPTLNGVDWEGARRELQPKVEAAASDEEARAAIAALIERLGQTHFSLIPSDLYQLLDDGGTPSSGDTGIRVRVLDNRAIVSSVVGGSPAARAGVRPGWEIVRFGGVEVRPRLERLVRELPETLLKSADLASAVEGRLKGRIGETATLTFDTGDGGLRELAVLFETPQGVRTIVGHLPPVWIRAETRELPGGIGYFALSGFANPVYVMDEFGKAVERFRNAAGLVIDLRGNQGGAGNIVVGMLGWLATDSDRQVGTVVRRGLTMKIIVQRRPSPFERPVAVLVDGLSVSGSEVFAAALQDMGRARIFGSRTAGAVLGSTVERLPNGDRFQYAFSDYISATGRRLEGHGVVPDIAVSLTRDALLKGSDPVIEAAVEWIRQRR